MCVSVAHRQLALTIPKRLLLHIRFARKLLGTLCACGNEHRSTTSNNPDSPARTVPCMSKHEVAQQSRYFSMPYSWLPQFSAQPHGVRADPNVGLPLVAGPLPHNLQTNALICLETAGSCVTPASGLSDAERQTPSGASTVDEQTILREQVRKWAGEGRWVDRGRWKRERNESFEYLLTQREIKAKCKSFRTIRTWIGATKRVPREGEFAVPATAGLGSEPRSCCEGLPTGSDGKGIDTEPRRALRVDTRTAAFTTWSDSPTSVSAWASQSGPR
jgi:hypothetical protein